jgi:predicted PurR-regulated permease PerM
MTTEVKEPFYKKLALVLVSLSLIAVMMIYGGNIVLPILFAVLLANILLPVVQFLQRKKFNRTFAILLPVFLSVVIGIGLLYFLSRQVITFMKDVPALKERVDKVSHDAKLWFQDVTGVKLVQQDKYIEESMQGIKDNAPRLVGSTVDTLSGVVVYFLIPIYTFFILFYRQNIKVFLVKVFKNDSEEKVKDILAQSTKVGQQYITGLLIETTLVFLFNAAGFLILGIKYAIFLALLAALLNLIPYVGILIANIICMLITLVTSDSMSSVIWVGVILAIVQVLDNNFGMPLIVGNKIRINPLVIIIGVIVGGALSGVLGMFLAIPTMAVLKIIFDKVPGLEPWAILMGDDSQPRLPLKIKLRGLKFK